MTDTTLASRLAKHRERAVKLIKENAPLVVTVDAVALAEGAKTTRPVKEAKVTVARAARQPRTEARYRLAATPTGEKDYVKKLLGLTTHNATVVKLLTVAGKGGLTLVELHERAVAQLGWTTTSPTPLGILGWHVAHLRERKIVEVVA